METLNTVKDNKNKVAFFTKKWLIFWLICISILIVGLILFSFGVGNIQNVASLYISIPMILAFLLFIISVPIWLIIKFKKKIIIPAIILLVVMAGGIFYYQRGILKQRKEACTAILNKNNENNILFKDWEIRSNLVKINFDANTPTGFAKNVANAKLKQSLNTEYFNIIRTGLDVYSKYLSLFTTYDMNNIYKSVQNVQDTMDKTYQTTSVLYQDILDGKSINDLQILQKNMSESYSKLEVDSKKVDLANGEFAALAKIVSLRCYDWFKISIITTEDNK